MKVLVADAQSIILKAIKRDFNLARFDVITALNGKTAIDLFDFFSPDLVILDINMSKKSSYEVIAHIKSSKNPNTPIIVTSATRDSYSVLKAYSEGADDFVHKTLELNVLVARAKRLLEIPLNSNDLDSIIRINAKKIHRNGFGVVIPCYNEEMRLKTDQFFNFVNNNTGYALCFVNDGSSDNTLEILQEYQKLYPETIYVQDCKKKNGNAEAVRQGFLHLLKDKSIDYFGFLGSGLSTAMYEFEELSATIASHSYKFMSDSKKNKGALIVKQRNRGIFSHYVNMLMNEVFKLDFTFTQNGAKILTREIVEYAFNEPFQSNMLFNVELQFRMKKLFKNMDVKEVICNNSLNTWEYQNKINRSYLDSFQSMNVLVTN